MSVYMCMAVQKHDDVLRERARGRNRSSNGNARNVHTRYRPYACAGAHSSAGIDERGNLARMGVEILWLDHCLAT